MPTISYSIGVTGAIPIQQQVARTADGVIGAEPTVNAAKALSAWVKTDANTAAGNLANGHGWSSGKCDVYWTGGRRYDVDATITVDAVALDGGSGDDFPTTGNSTVVLAMHQQANVTIDGDNVELIALCFESTTPTSTARGHAHFEDAAGDVILDLDFDANEPKVYDIEGGATNVFTGDVITTVYITMDSTSETVKFKVTGVQDV